MRRKFVIVIYLQLLKFCAFSQTDTIHFFPGQGIDNIKLFKTSGTEVKKFKGVKYSKDKGAAIEYGPEIMRNRWKEYHSDSLGLTFKFATKWRYGERAPILRKMQLQEIDITKMVVVKME